MKEIPDYLPRDYDDLTPDEYLALDSNTRANIERTAIIPSNFSSSNFGGLIRVFYHNPVYGKKK